MSIISILSFSSLGSGLYFKLRYIRQIASAYQSVDFEKDALQKMGECGLTWLWAKSPSEDIATYVETIIQEKIPTQETDSLTSYFRGSGAIERFMEYGIRVSLSKSQSFPY
jgi:hypothetical protein